MKRFALAAGLLAAAAPTSEAGYLVVRVLLEGSGGGGSVAAGGPSAPGGYGGMPFGPGGGGMPFGPPGAPGGPAGGGLSGGAGLGGGMKPGGGGGLFRPPGGYGGQPGYGPPGAFQPAGAGGPPSDPTRSIFVVVPFTRPPERRPFYPRLGDHPVFNPEWRLGFAHPHGYTNLFVDNSAVQAYTDFGLVNLPVNKTRQSLVVEKHDRWVKNPADGQILLDLVTEALAYGMVREAVQYADELAAAAADKKTRTTPPVDAFLAAYARVQKPLRDLPAQRGDGAAWAKRFADGEFRGAQSVTRGHYDLVYWKDTSEEDRARRLGQLEDNLRAFYLWHATQGRALPVPDRPLTAVLPGTAKDTIALANSLDRFPVVADSFYAPEHDLLVLAPERLDEVGQTFQRQLQQVYRGGADRKALLDGNSRRPPVVVDTTGRTKDSKQPDEVALMMTYAMVERYAADATEWQAVSREGSRQLLYATGLLPRHVTLPLWLSNGGASFFQRPRGPVFTTKEDGEKEKTVATVGLTTGYGVPNFVYQKQFRELIEKRQLNPDPARTLQNVVTDAYFVALAVRVDADDPRLPLAPVVAKKKDPPAGTGGPFGPRPGDFLTQAGPAPPDPKAVAEQRALFLRDKAYATSWALYYHLAKNHPDGLARYSAELARMPRDLPLDEATRLELFARAFNLTAGPAGDGRESFGQFAARWLKAMEGLPPAGVDIELIEPTPPAAGGAAAGMPNFPGFPPVGGGAGGPGDGTP
jgi:hypothetical protein